MPPANAAANDSLDDRLAALLGEVLEEERQRIARYEAGTHAFFSDSLRRRIEEREAELADEDALDAGFEKYIVRLPNEERPQRVAQIARAYNEWKDQLQADVDSWQSELTELDNRRADRQAIEAIVKSARRRVDHLFDCFVQEDVDRKALVAFYHATGGDNWKVNTNWLTDAPLDEWYGVGTRGAGRVDTLVPFLGRYGVRARYAGCVDTLSLRNNGLTGKIPAELGNIAYLNLLNLSDNQLTGEIPTELVRITRLNELHLDGNDLTGEIPTEWSNIGSLNVLGLGGNQLTGSIPAELGRLYQLEALRLDDNQLTGEIPLEFHDLTLKVLRLSGNQLTGCVPSVLRDVAVNDLARLGLPFCPYQEAEDRAALIALYRSADGDNWSDNTNWLSDARLGEWYGVTTNAYGNVKELDLESNQLNGKIPAELGSLTELEYLDLQGNQLSGEIPAELGNLSNLKHVRLNGNQITGQIPVELGDLSQLESLWINDNQLSGEIPAELGNLSHLEYLFLENNQLTGRIPTELRNLPELVELWLDGNQLTEQKIPVYFQLGSNELE